MTDDEFADLPDYEDDPSVQAAKETLLAALQTATERRNLAEAAAAKAEAERRAADPRHARDFDRTECSPDCKTLPPGPGIGPRPWVRHTNNLGYCIEAHRPKTTALNTYVDLEARLEEVEEPYQGITSGTAADVALLWLAEHPEAAAEIWPQPAGTFAAAFTDLAQQATQAIAEAHANVRRIHTPVPVPRTGDQRCRYCPVEATPAGPAYTPWPCPPIRAVNAYETHRP